MTRRGRRDGARRTKTVGHFYQVKLEAIHPRSRIMGCGMGDDDGVCNIGEVEFVAMISCDDVMGQREMIVAKTATSPSFPCCRRVRFNYAMLAALFFGVFVRPRHYLRAYDVALKPLMPSPLFAKSKKNHHNGQHVRHNSPKRNSIGESSGESITRIDEVKGSKISNAPLFYHVSPGSTGSRTFYHAACASGFPSVHHKSFCISRTRGIRGVDDEVVYGVRSHFQLLRLYEMAADCSSLWSKGKIRMVGDYEILEHRNNSNKNSNTTSASVATQQICNTSLRQWSNEVQSHLANVVQSGLVGLFDTPYPYMAPQVLKLANELRATHPIIAITEREPSGWASSRSRNHGILVCKDEYSLEGLGSSEFDVIGCIERALESNTGNLSVKLEPSEDLHFWHAFRYRSIKEPVNKTFQLGMERQMEHHQVLYLPMSQYAPDMFGVRLPSRTKSRVKPIEEKDVARDIRHVILSGRQSDSNHDSNAEELRPAWRDSYTKSFTCRGRVNWESKNDTLVEYYRFGCEDMLSSSKARKVMGGSVAPVIPLILS